MLAISESALLISFAVIQVLGLTSLACARLKGDTFWNRSFRVLFMFSLVGVGMATMCAVGCASDWWISCGTTLAVMSVGGTIDLGRSARDSVLGFLSVADILVFPMQTVQ